MALKNANRISERMLCREISKEGARGGGMWRRKATGKPQGVKEWATGSDGCIKSLRIEGQNSGPYLALKNANRVLERILCREISHVTFVSGGADTIKWNMLTRIDPWAAYFFLDPSLATLKGGFHLTALPDVSWSADVWRLCWIF